MAPKLGLYTPPVASTEMGIESLSITLNPSCSGAAIGNNTPRCKSGSALSILSWTTNSFARDVSVTGFNDAIKIAQNASMVTLERVIITRNGKTDNSAGYAADITISGTQVLVLDSETRVSDPEVGMKAFPVVTQGLTPGPNCVVRYTAAQKSMMIQVRPPFVSPT